MISGITSKTKIKGKNKFFFLIGIIVLVVVAVNLTKTWMKSHEINQEITGLEQEIDNLIRTNDELKGLIQYFNSDAYVEEKARIDLGLKKEGEKVVIITDQNGNGANNQNPRASGETDENSVSNPQKWWVYLNEADPALKSSHTGLHLQD